MTFERNWQTNHLTGLKLILRYYNFFDMLCVMMKLMVATINQGHLLNRYHCNKIHSTHNSKDS